MGCCFFCRNVNTAFQGCFTGQTVRGLNPVWGVRVQGRGGGPLGMVLRAPPGALSPARGQGSPQWHACLGVRVLTSLSEPQTL